MTKRIKTIVVVIITAIVLLVAILSTTIGIKNKNINKLKNEISLQERTIEEQKEMIKKLAAMEAVRCEVTINVKNTAVMGSNKSGDIQQDAKQLATYLKGEILNELLNKE